MKFATVATALATGAVATRAPTLNKNAGFHSSPSRLSEVNGEGNVNAQLKSHNWAGAVKHSTNIRYVTGEVVVPKPRTPADADPDTTYYASAWVGIDGDKCRTGLLQTGVQVGVQGDQVKSSAWFEWIPETSHDFDLEVNVGDRIRMTVDATDLHSGWASIENLSTGRSGNHTFPHKKNSLCETDMEFIVERFDQIIDGQQSPVPYADVGTVDFTNCYGMANGQKIGLDGSDNLELLNDNDDVVTKCTVGDDSSLTCQYTG